MRLDKRKKIRMEYERIQEAIFLERPNRFIAHVLLDGKRTVVHVKNTGRCRELLVPGVAVYVQHNPSKNRKTQYDLIAVKKKGRLINMDSQAPNDVVAEYLAERFVRLEREHRYGNSRIDLYGEDSEGRRYLIEVKGVTLEENGLCLFPDAPSERALKHVEELVRAKEEGYEAWIFFLIQMAEAYAMIPNEQTHPAFARALDQARHLGVRLMAYTCDVTESKLQVKSPVPVVTNAYALARSAGPVADWFAANQRDLPWRRRVSAYRVWISEIMLQQTRVEAAKPYFERFVEELPDVESLARVSDDRLMKLWEGLGYYSRARHLKEAAGQIMERYDGVFPDDYEAILSLKGIGTYTAGAISAFAFGKPKAAVDGNVLRVVSRLLGLEEDVMLASTKKRIEKIVESCIPPERASDFGQGLIELGALICLPKEKARCEICPAAAYCTAFRTGKTAKLPVRILKTKRRVEKRTVLRICYGNRIGLSKRPDTGLLAGLYELPNVEGHLSGKETLDCAAKLGFSAIRYRPLPASTHVFSHITWDMIGYEIEVDELSVDRIAVESAGVKVFFAGLDELDGRYAIPSAFLAYMPTA